MARRPDPPVRDPLRSPALARRRRAIPVIALALVALVFGIIEGAGPRDAAQRRLAERYAAAWSRGDYGALYALVDPGTRDRLPYDRFVHAYRAAAATATVSGARPGRAGASGGGEAVALTVYTRVFGELRLTQRLPMTGGPTGPVVRWSENLVFPGLRPGERLSRQTQLPARTTLLTREGTVLAGGAPGPDGQRSSPLGSAATAISGRIGPIPKGQELEFEATGVPPGSQVGITGLERALEEQLHGSPGGVLRAGSRTLASAAPHAAAPVRSTISAHLQGAAVTALGSRTGGVVALRPDGELLAAAGLPLSDLQPPGSTFKIITVTGALEAGIANPGTQFPVQTAATLSGVKLQNANGESCGGTLTEAFAISCNSVFAPLGAKLGAGRLVSVAQRFGFNDPPGIPGAATSTIPPAARIGDDLAVGSTAIGQGDVQASALQMAIAAATIGNEGRRPRPTVLPGPPAPMVTATSPRVARLVRSLMLEVVRSGTGTSAQVPGVKVAGKTGTAELRSTVCTPADPSGCAASGDPRNTDAWFVAFAPALAPRVVVGAVLWCAGAGGDTAAPLAADVLRAGLSGR